MGKGQEMAMCDVEKASGRVLLSDLGVPRQRKLVCIALFVALLPFAIMRSYLFYTSSNVPSENNGFFQGQRAPESLNYNPSGEDVSESTDVMDSPNDSSSSTQTDNDPTGTGNEVDGSEPSISGGKNSNSTSVDGEDNESEAKDSGMKNPNFGESDFKSTNASASGTEDGNNVSSSSFLEDSGGEPPVNNSTAVYNSTVEGDTSVNDTRRADESSKEGKTGEIVMEGTPPTPTSHDTSYGPTSQGECNLEQGKWIPDSTSPQYNSTTCRFIQGHQNCHKNGRPDDGYLYWKWKPEQCDLPKIDAPSFLTAMRNRSMVFAGDSIARNQFQSLLCVLVQVEDPKNTYHTEDDRFNTYLFRSFNFTLSIHWSPYLVRVEDKSITWPDNTTETVKHIYVDELDEVWVKAAVGVDILHISTGQWWYKKAMYFEKGNLLGCHGLPACKNEIGFDPPYNKAIANILKGSLTIPGFSGTTVYRSFTPEHFEDGDWDSGGRCPRTTPGGVPMSFLTKWMYDIQMRQFKNTTEELGVVAKDRLKLLRITHLSQMRPDGHPNSYRTKDDKAKDKRGNIIPNDCLHWCLPGPIDTWNDMLVHSLRDVIFK
ncbi:xyloglucan O-acetyltransferase 1 [Physcomitrium patens]|uniref:Mannan O-acetyltransferase 6 n=1 Tax=Physcomitrium patens TaxID=3218 RepID=A0A2K1KCR2_PHYPA|nr:protein ALTERED XYLOGLUCAN 4-like [Physcomitrium patens]PNR51573.1 hypothetical protein PHYPA_010760 [Physcomitrium patens]QDE12525.1 mannan O-acetyltransferase 6 [Physcomitrium patens]|eukprot:XP_024381548.1 protein ALTERED XYLOGLUCAN 4-like [Physcomitrella patens]